jgi:hypothetical protein
MGVLTKATDTVYTLRFLRLLTTPFEETNAYKEGLIDDEGNKLKKPFTEKEKSVYNMFHRLVFNIKKLLAKVPGGKSKLASYASALYLVKEHLNLSDKSIEKILRECQICPSDFLSESTRWFTTADGMLSPGVYRLAEGAKMVNSTGEEFGKKDDMIRVEEDCYPVSTLFGLDIYEVIHTPTHQKIYVTAGELLK